jgi:hypothetical protein
VSASEPLDHLYALALRTLDEQERRAEALRGRLGPVLATAALGASLLSGPLLGGGEPVSVAGTLAAAAALAGLVVTIAAAFKLLRASGRVTFGTDVPHMVDVLDHDGALDDITAFYSTMIARLGEIAARDAAMLDRLGSTLTAMLCGILVMLCGLAFAAIVG